MIPLEATLERLRDVLGELVAREVPVADGLACLEVEPARLREVARRLRDEDRLRFETNTFLTAVDLFPAEPRFRLVYQFLSVARTERVRLHCLVRSDDAMVPTITDLWPGTGYFEREVFDMFGIRFEGHPNLRRLLMPEGFDHFPLRKDFPHQGIEPDRLYREWDRKRRRSPEQALEPER